MKDSNAVCIAGVGMTAFGKHLDSRLSDLAGEAARAALEHARADADDVDLVVMANSMAGLLQGQESVRGQVALAGGALAGKPLVNVENACASSSSAVQVASWALLGGAARSVLVVAVEKLFHPDKTATFRALASASDAPKTAENRSMFMDFYARRAQRHMREYGTTVEQLAAVSVKNRGHGALNPLAQFRHEVALEDVLNSRMIVDPLTLLMCSPVSDGAAALLLTRRRDLTPGAPAVAIRGFGLSSGDSTGPEYETIKRTAQVAYQAAGLTAKDVDVAEVHDATSIAEIEACEALGLAERGEGGALAESGAAALDWQVPVNPSRGHLSRGHPVAATGAAQLAELTWQLRGEAGDRQVNDAVVAVAENHGGLVGDDVAVATVTILERVA